MVGFNPSEKTYISPRDKFTFHYGRIQSGLSAQEPDITYNIYIPLWSDSIRPRGVLAAELKHIYIPLWSDSIHAGRTSVETC